jgi:hypothetical protein
MIARIWHGYRQPEHADAYQGMLKPTWGGKQPRWSQTILNRHCANRFRFNKVRSFQVTWIHC